MKYPDAFEKFVCWYQQQCDGDWEHEFGFKMTSQDSPGWVVCIDITRTGIWRKKLDDIDIVRSPADWVKCFLKTGTVFGYDEAECVHFVAYGGIDNISEILNIFLVFAEQ